MIIFSYMSSLPVKSEFVPFVASYLQHQQNKKVGISNPLELFKQVERKEGEEIVLWGLDGVCLWKVEMKENKISDYKK